MGVSESAQICCQNCVKAVTIGPVSVVHCSSHVSQLIFAEGRNNVWPSMIQNLLWSTLNGRKKILFMLISSPSSSSGPGSPMVTHVLGRCIFPRGEDV